MYGLWIRNRCNIGIFMEPIKVFVSSAYRDVEFRQAAVESISSLPGFVPLTVEMSPATMRAPEQMVLNAIATADVFVVIVGAYYVAPVSNKGKSFTEFEYDAAVKAGKPVVAFVLKNAPSGNLGEVTRLKIFKTYLAANHPVKIFDSSEQLRTDLSNSLLALKKERLGPTFDIVFDPQLTERQIKASFQALAEYYRACGGVGLEVEFERLIDLE
jgi:Domain of unknown function (DUF4062)